MFRPDVAEVAGSVKPVEGPRASPAPESITPVRFLEVEFRPSPAIDRWRTCSPPIPMELCSPASLAQDDGDEALSQASSVSLIGRAERLSIND